MSEPIKFWTIVSGGRMSHTIHTTREAADTAADMSARNRKGEFVYVLEAVAAYRSVEVEVFDLSGEEDDL